MPYIHDGVNHITVLYSQNDNIVGQVIEQEGQEEDVDEKTVFERKPIEEYLAGIFTSYMGLGSLYLAANALAFPASYLLNEHQLAQYYKIWRSKRLSKEIILEGQTLPLLPTIEQQVELLNERQLLAPIYQKIKYRMKHNQPLMEEKLNWLIERAKKHGDTAEKNIARVCKLITEFWLIYTANMNSVTTEAELAELKDWQHFLDNNKVIVNDFFHMKDFASLTGDIGKRFSWVVPQQDPLIANILHILCSNQMQQKLIAFVCCAEFSSNHEKVRRGLGWSGIDDFTLGHWRDKIDNVKTTQWIYFHSDMKIPSEDVMEHIYKDKIISTINFGLYPKENQSKDNE